MTEDLLEFPCAFPVKAMGRSHPEFSERVTQIIGQHAAIDATAAIREQQSNGGRFISVTVTITAESRAQLEAIYAALKDESLVLMVL